MVKEEESIILKYGVLYFEYVIYVFFIFFIF